MLEENDVWIYDTSSIEDLNIGYEMFLRFTHNSLKNMTILHIKLLIFILLPQDKVGLLALNT
jgi:hypothetical protein